MQHNIEPRQLERAVTTLRNALDDDYYGKWFITNITPHFDGSVTVTAAYLLPWEDDESHLEFMTKPKWSHVTVESMIGATTVRVIDDYPATQHP